MEKLDGYPFDQKQTRKCGKESTSTAIAIDESTAGKTNEKSFAYLC